jgi:type I restriction enzyme S subunit
LQQGWSPQCEDRLTDPGEYGVVKAGCVNGGRFHPLEHKALPADAFPRLEYLLRAGDLLVSRASGSLDLIGSAAVIPVDSPTNLMLCDKVYRLAVDSGADASYIAVMLQAHQVRELIKLGVSGAEGMANNLPSSVIRALPVPAAPVEEQRDVVRQAQASSIRTARLADVFERSIAALVEHRQALISAAVTGELDVPEMRENPSHLVCPTTARG